MSAPSSLPIDVVDALPPLLRELVSQQWTTRRYPEELVLSVGIGALFALCMPLAVVKHHGHMISPLSGYVIVSTKTGIGKTEVFDGIFQPIIDRAATADPRLEVATLRFNLEVQRWKLKDEELEKAIRKALRNGSPSDQIQADRVTHHSNMPHEPLRDLTLIQVMSKSAFLKTLHGHNSRVILAHAEGQEILESEMMQCFDVLCTAWDGKNPSLRESARSKIKITQPYFSILLLSQPIFVQPFLKRNKEAAINSGFIPRTLFAAVTSKGPSEKFSPWQVPPAFQARSIELLDEVDKRCTANEIPREVLAFSPEAEQLWDDESGNINAERQPGGKLTGIDGFAARFMEHVTRIAGVFHVFSNHAGNSISRETMQSAIMVARWYLAEHKRNFDEDDGPTRTVRDAWRDLKHLYVKHWLKGHSQVLYNDLLNSGPSSTREVRYLRPAIDHLVNKRYVTIGTRDGSKVIYLNSNRFRNLVSETFEDPMPDDFSRPSINVPLPPTPQFEDSTLPYLDFGIVSNPTAGR